MFKESNGPIEVEKQEQLAAVYERANQLNLAGYKTTCVNDNNKFSTETNWPAITFVPEMGMTGVCIVPSEPIKGTGLYFIVIDIDIFDPEKREAVFKKIMARLDRDRVYIELTTSGGYHIIFFSDSYLKGKDSVLFCPQNDNAKHKDQVEIFTGGNYQIMTAPSIAKNKQGEIGQYRKISEIDLGVALLKQIGNILITDS